jgi:hypothetical protein
MSRPYVHTPLTDSFSTRILLLEPAVAPTAPLRCSLQEVSFCSNPEYSALSYSWDAQTPCCPIECDSGILHITSNCQAALQRLRKEHDECRLWIDGICIDQASLIERNQQVALMGEIYKRAKSVIVWLGEGDPATEIATQRLLDIGQLSVMETRNEEEEKRWGASMKVLYGIGVREESQDPLSPLFKLTWFYRMWTVQEVTLPLLDNVEVRYGSISSKWVFVLFAINLLEAVKYKWGAWNEATRLQKDISAMFMDKRDPSCQGILQTDATLYEGILQLLVSMRPKQATDPRDKVFALVGVAHELGLDLPLPDYQKLLSQVYV